MKNKEINKNTIIHITSNNQEKKKDNKASEMYQKSIYTHTISLEMSNNKRPTHESTADFQLLMSFWSVSSPKDSERRLWVLTMETTFDSCDGLPNGCLSSGT